MARSAEKPWRNVWIIGASTGIGRALAFRLAPLCDHLHISARTADALNAVAAEAPNITCHPLDVTQSDAVTAVAHAIDTPTAPLDLVVISSGIWKQTTLPELDLATFRQSMEVNYLGAVHVIGATAPGMTERGGGHIAIVSSLAGYRGLPNATAYGPTKAALINLAESIRPQLRRMGVTVSLVNPGFVETPMTAVNRFAMPFLQTPEQAAERIATGLLRRSYEIAFPRRFAWIFKLLRILPHGLFFWIIDRFVLRRRK